MKTNRKIVTAMATIMALVLIVSFALPVGAFAATDDTSASNSEITAPVAAAASSDNSETLAPDTEDTAAVLYDIYFYNADESLFQQEQVPQGEALAPPFNTPNAPAGTAFSGWFEKGATEPYQFEGSIISSEVKLYAMFTAITTSENVPTVGNSTPAARRAPAPVVADAEHTVTFMVNGTSYVTQTVLHETLVSLPNNPGSQGGMLFIGWYTEAGVPFGPYQLITENLTLTAKFSNNIVLVTYLDTDGSILDVVEGTKGQPAPAPSNQPNLGMGKELLYWALPGSENAFTDNLTQNVTLVPVLADISMAVFVTQGSEISPQTGANGFNATEPTTVPSRDGYIFLGWSQSENGADDFDFAGTAIEGTVFIYAKWQATSASYTVNIWVEKTNVENPGNPLDTGRSNYEIRYTTTKTGTTGATVSLDETEARALADSANTDVKNLLTYSTFKASEERTISANGDTIVNVFFTRTVFTFNFDVSATTQDGTIYLRDGSSVGNYYTIKVKIEQDVSEIWPSSVIFSATSASFKNWSGFYSNNSCIVGYSHISVAFSAPTAMQSNFYYAITAPKRFEVTLTAGTITNFYTETRQYYLELTAAEKAIYLANGSLPGETVRTWSTNHATYGGLRYYKLAFIGGTNNQGSNPATAAKGWPGRDFEGFETIGSTSGVCRTTDFQEIVFNSGKDYTLNYFMPRKSNTLTLITGNGIIINANSRLAAGNGNYTACLQYGEDLSSILPASVNLANYTFGGWYLDEQFETSYVAVTMPGGNLTLYAKFTGTEVSVTYTDGPDILTNTYARGEKLNTHKLDGTVYANAKKGDVIPGKGVFMGWYYEVGTTTTATVEFPVGLSLTRDSYVLTAQLAPQTYTVTFKGDEGGSQPVIYATQKVNSGNNNTLARSGHINLVPRAREGYIFKGWSTTKGGTVANFNTATRILSNTTVYAVWQIIPVTVSFNANGGIATPAVLQRTLDYGQSLEDATPDIPGATSVKWEGHTFGGWYTRPTGGQPVNVRTRLTKDTTVYAHWNKVESTTSTFTAPPESETSSSSSSTSSSTSIVPIGIIEPASASNSDARSASISSSGIPALTVSAPADDQSVSVLNSILTDGTVPLENRYFSNSWSLLSLIMALGGVVISALLLISMVDNKKKAGKKEQYAKNASDANFTSKALSETKRGRILKALTILLGAFTALLFLALDNLSLPMIFVNQWTLWIAVPFVATIVTFAIQLMVKRNQRTAQGQSKSIA